MKLIKKREYEQFARVYGPQIYGYLAGIVALTTLGMILQSYFVPERTEENDQKTIVKKDDFIKTDNQVNNQTGENKNTVQPKEEQIVTQLDENKQKAAVEGENNAEKKENQI